MAILGYEPGAAFPGVTGRTAEESAPAWPAPVRARDGAPNVVFIVLDDTGSGQLGCYGSPIETPSFDSPSRANHTTRRRLRGDAASHSARGRRTRRFHPFCVMKGDIYPPDNGAKRGYLSR
jgi:hypothetical protein